MKESDHMLEATIKEKVSKDPRWAQKAIIVLFERQTPDEQDQRATRYKNHIGFNGADAEILSSFASRLIWQRKPLTDKQLAIAYKKLPKYSKQLLEIAKEKGNA